MSFTVENLEEKNMVKLVIESTAEEFEAGLNTAYNKNKSKISLPGFRKGKAPRRILEMNIGKEAILDEAVINQKYELTDIAHEKYPFLHRIRALRDIGKKVKT